MKFLKSHTGVMSAYRPEQGIATFTPRGDGDRDPDLIYLRLGDGHPDPRLVVATVLGEPMVIDVPNEPLDRWGRVMLEQHHPLDDGTMAERVFMYGRDPSVIEELRGFILFRATAPVGPDPHGGERYDLLDVVCWHDSSVTGVEWRRDPATGAITSEVMQPSPPYLPGLVPGVRILSDESLERVHPGAVREAVRTQGHQLREAIRGLRSALPGPLAEAILAPAAGLADQLNYGVRLVDNNRGRGFVPPAHASHGRKP